MVQKVKDVIIKSLIQIAVGVIISVTAVAYTNSKSDSRVLEKRVNELELEKLSKSEYVEDQEKKDEKHKLIHERDRQDLLYIRARTDDIYNKLYELSKQ